MCVCVCVLYDAKIGTWKIHFVPGSDSKFDARDEGLPIEFRWLYSWNPVLLLAAILDLVIGAKMLICFSHVLVIASF